jgi:NAD(P)-dependent dehydrogenase (short-subunit alcohol dehydrogenase family)
MASNRQGPRKLNGRVAIVTGAGGGLGRSHAKFLARHGARVVINDMTPAAEEVATEIRSDGGEAVALVGSVTSESDVAAMVEAALVWGRIDILVNNAGTLRDSSFVKMSIEDFRAVMDVHLIGAAICTKAVWSTMREQHYGRVVMTTSSTGLFGNFGQANYGAAKMALVGLMQTLGIEGAKYDIRVNCLAPTATTAMTKELLPAEVQERLRPDLVGPGLLKLVSENAPNRAILCAGAGHFERSFITLTRGSFIGDGPDAAERLEAQWDVISDRSGDCVPEQGSEQLQREVSAALLQTDSAGARS